MFNSLMFRHKNAFAYFKKIMIDILDEPDDVAVVLFDYIVLFGDDPEKVWETAIRVVCKLTTAGLMLTIKIPEFLYTEVIMLGFL